MVPHPRPSARRLKLRDQSTVSRSGKVVAVHPDITARMRAVRRRNTKAELELAAALGSRRMRFMTHVPLFGCTPDIVFSRAKVLVFVDGDFWHGRILLEKGMQGLKRTFRNDARAFWVLKIARNVDRDARQSRLLRRHGWAVLRLWEKDVLRDVNGAAAIVSQRVLARRAKLKPQEDVA